MLLGRFTSTKNLEGIFATNFDDLLRSFGFDFDPTRAGLDGARSPPRTYFHSLWTKPPAVSPILEW